MFHRSMFKAYFVALIILILCLLPSQTFPKVGQPVVGLDKLIHLLMYVPLAWVLIFGFKVQSKYRYLQQRAFFYALMFAGLYGAFIEVLQMCLTVDRMAEWLDFAADILGLLIGALSYRWGEKLILWWNRLWGKSTTQETRNL